jgi:hypothetical protein
MLPKISKVAVDEAILGQADEIDAAAIVLGSRSRSNLRFLLLGDIANEVAPRATRPVLLAPSGDLSRRRRDERTREVSEAFAGRDTSRELRGQPERLERTAVDIGEAVPRREQHRSLRLLCL